MTEMGAPEPPPIFRSEGESTMKRFYKITLGACALAAIAFLAIEALGAVAIPWQ